jgi:hypothetical protein
MRMLPKQLLHILLHPRPLNTLSPSFETTGLEDEQQRNRSQSPHMLVPLPSSSPFFETKGLELEPQTNRSQSLHTPVSCCRPSRHFHYPASNMHPFSHPSPPNSPAPDPLSHPPLARARVQTRWPKVLCAVRLRICGVITRFVSRYSVQSFIFSFCCGGLCRTSARADSCPLQRLNCWAQHLRTQQRSLLGRRVLYPAKYFAG